MRYYLLALLIFLLAACNNQDKKQAENPVASEPEKTGAGDKKIAAPVNEQTDSVIHFSFDRDSSSLTASGFIKSARDHITGYLPVDRKAQLTAWLIPKEKDMNIRFTQLIMPDSTMDGPFGTQFKYALQQKGMYKIIISANTMADGSTKGDFLIRLQVKENK